MMAAPMIRSIPTMTDAPLFPPQLVRETTADYMDVQQEEESMDQRRTRYLQIDVAYRACKYQEHITWGELFERDRPHFVELMTHHVGVDTKLFAAFLVLLSPQEQEEAKIATRQRDTAEGAQERLDYYLGLTCSHKGKMNGKTWGWIQKNNYNYLVWSVGNAMGRDTRTFKALLMGLKQYDQKYVLRTEKGRVSMQPGGRK